MRKAQRIPSAPKLVEILRRRGYDADVSQCGGKVALGGACYTIPIDKSLSEAAHMIGRAHDEMIGISKKTWSEAATLIFPRVLVAGAEAAVELGDLGGGLRVRAIIEGVHTVHQMTTEHLRHWSITAEDLEKTVRFNLAERFSKAPREEDYRGWVYYEFPEAAALIWSTELWREFTSAYGRTFVGAIPRRNTLMIAGLHTHQFRNQVDHLHKRGPDALVNRSFIITADGAAPR